METIQLTQTVQKGGCAAKVAAVELRKILAQVRFPARPKNLLIDGSHFDDAAVVEITPEIASVQTVDFFTPIVDTPRLFGRIAAANALSDVYAMGGEPESALAILAFPMATLPNEVASEVLQGACDVLSEAGAALVGGHSIDDDTLKFGLSVTGRVHPKRIWSNAGAKPGDLLILTKALGTGTLTAALKRRERTEEQISEALDSMGALNRIRDLLSESELSAIHAATDITGFGVCGHLQQMALASKVQMRFQFGQLPWLNGAEQCLASGFLTKAHRTNAEYTADRMQTSAELAARPDHELKILFDPQTSGGLCLSVAPSEAPSILSKLRQRFPKATVIGAVESAGDPNGKVLSWEL